MAQQQKTIPSIEDIRSIAETALSTSVKKLERFNTGNHHFVYDVHLSDGRNVVVRVAYPEEKKAIEGAVYWSNLLKPRGIPLPEILQADATCTKFPFPYMILQRFLGTDLRYVYKTLSIPQRRAVVSELIKIQNSVTGLPQEKGFGYTERMGGPFSYQNWKSLVADGISRTRARITQAGHFSLESIECIESVFKELGGYFDGVRPTPFLHDMTSKNVLIHKGRLTGIVDVDSLCFGDPLYLPGLIQAAFLADGLEDDYIGYWKEALSLDKYQQRVVDFYSAQSLAYIMSEVGLQMNQAEQKSPVTDEVKHLSASLNMLLDKLSTTNLLQTKK